MEPMSEDKQLQVAEETHFYNLFAEVTNEIQEDIEIDGEQISEAIDFIKQTFRDMEESGFFSAVDLRRYDYICGYIFRYAVPWTGLVRQKLLEANRNCPELESCLRKEGVLRVVSLGCGPGSDVVGFCSAFQSLGSPCQSLDITLLDKVEQFHTCVDLVENLVRKGNFGSFSTLLKEKEVRMWFQKEDVRNEDEREYLDVLKNADIILVTWLFSILMLSDIPKVLEILHENMKQDALLLYIDSPRAHRDQNGKFCYNGYNYFKYDFDLLYHLPPEMPYTLSQHQERFGHWNDTSPNAHVAVLRKARCRIVPPVLNCSCSCN